jgi:hypothetical protein
MTGRTEHGTEGSINSARLAALLDKLVAVDLDLSPICRGSEEGPVLAAGDAIADACAILRSAIADLRNIVHQIDGLTYLLSRRPGPAGAEFECFQVLRAQAGGTWPLRNVERYCPLTRVQTALVGRRVAPGDARANSDATGRSPPVR